MNPSLLIEHEENGTKTISLKPFKVISLEYPCSSQTTCSAYTITFPRGLYYLEVWGAQGYSFSIAKGGYGGYSAGVFSVPDYDMKLYLHIGGLSKDTLEDSYNGGTKGYTDKKDGPGGGATDFRLNPGNWDENFDSRIIVAGGGGGAYQDGVSLYFDGGRGGGITGETGTNEGTSISPVGTQEDGKTGGKGDFKEGHFGYSAGQQYGSGGSGYYGGGTADRSGGGGGSGYAGGVLSYHNFLNHTEFSANEGPGKAKITVIQIFRKRIKTCITSTSKINIYLYIVYIYK